MVRAQLEFPQSQGLINLAHNSFIYRLVSPAIVQSWNSEKRIDQCPNRRSHLSLRSRMGNRSSSKSLCLLRRCRILCKARRIHSIARCHYWKHTLVEIVKFREMLEQRLEEKQSPLETISDDFLPLIAKLVQERSVPWHHIFALSSFAL